MDNTNFVSLMDFLEPEFPLVAANDMFLPSIEEMSNDLENIITENDLQDIMQNDMQHLGKESDVDVQANIINGSILQIPDDGLEAPLLASVTNPNSKLHKLSTKKTLQCTVCDQACEKRTFYGALACHSCRMFFRRSVKNNKHRAYRCREGGRCKEVPERRWLKCQRCRFEGCLNAGMTVASMEDVTARQFKVLPTRRLADVVTLEEKILIKGMLTMFLKREADICVNLLTNEPWSPDPSLNRQMKMMHLVRQESRKFFRKTNDMQSLSKYDQELLLEVNNPAAFEFLVAIWLGEKSKQYQMLQSKFEVGLKESAKEGSCQQLLKALMSQNKFGLHLANENYCSAMPKTSREQDIYSHMSADDNGDEITVMLVFLMILYSPDGLMDLQNRDAVDGIRTKFAHMLHRYLRETASGTGGERRRFRSAVYMVSYAREASALRMMAVTR